MIDHTYQRSTNRLKSSQRVAFKNWQTFLIDAKVLIWIGKRSNLCNFEELTLNNLLWHMFRIWWERRANRLQIRFWGSEVLLYIVQLIQHPILRIPNFNLPNLSVFFFLIYPAQHDGVRTTMKKRYTQNSFKIHF